MLHSHLQAWRRNLLDMRVHQLLDFSGVLIGNESTAHLRHRLRRQYSLCALARVAAENSVHFARRTRPESLENRVAFFTVECRCSDFLDEFFFVERKAFHLLTNLRLPLAHLIVESFDSNVTIAV